MTTLGLIDVSHIFRSAWHATADEPLSTAFNHTIKTVLRISQATRLDHTVVCLDKPPYNRKNIFPEYKANREKPDPVMFEQLKRVYEKLDTMGIKMASAPSFEADDIIATLTKHAKANGWKVEIFSADKDLMQLVDLDVTQVSTRDGTRYDYATVKAKFGVPPNKLGDYLALMGDSSDNIPGCPGVGAKSAVKLLTEYGDLDGILAAEIPGKMGEKIAANVELIQLSRVLVELQKDAPIVWGELFDAPESTKKVKTMTEEKAPEPTFTDAQFEDEPHDPTAGDMLVSGALKRQVNAVAPPPTSAPKQRETPVPEAPKPGPGIVKAQPAEVVPATVELRPGLSVSSAQLRLYSGLAKEFHKGGLYQRSFDTEAAIFTVILMGLGLGLDPITALNTIHVIEGRPSPGAHLLISRAAADPNCDWFECMESTTTSATYKTKMRTGSKAEKTFTYTIEDAKRAGMLTGGSRYNWEKRPREMLAKTAGSQAARQWYPGSITGLYSHEEMGHLAADDAA